MLLGIAVGRASALGPTWTTTHLATTALARGWRVAIIEAADFGVEGRAFVARAHYFDSVLGAEDFVNALRGRTARRRILDPSTLDLLLLRASPLRPELLSWALMLRQRAVSVVNEPVGILTVGRKAWLAAQPGIAIPETIVTGSEARALLFLESCDGRAIIKPLSGSGGKSVSIVSTPDELRHAFAIASQRAPQVVIQAIIEDVSCGEKRLVVLDGEVLGGYLRKRASGELCHNLARGGLAETTEITATDHALVQPLAQPLRAAGIVIAGIDVIGDRIVEVNALNPGGTFHTDRLTGTALAERILCRFEEKPQSLAEVTATPVHRRL